MPRQKLPASERRTTLVTFLVTSTEKAALSDIARRYNGGSLSITIREAVRLYSANRKTEETK